MATETGVVIVGGGPNGLMLAGELCRAGVRPVLLERLPDRSGPVRANGLVGTVVGVLHQRGLFEPLAPGGAAEPSPSPFYLFGGFPLDLRALAGNPLYGLPVPQPKFEEFLEGVALGLGADLRRGHEMVGFEQGPDSVLISVRGPEGGYLIEADYLVGCDGASSTVRKLAGIEFADLGDQDIVARGADVILPEDVIAAPVAGGPDSGVVPLAGGLLLPGLGRVPFGFTRTGTGLFGVTSLAPGVHTVHTTEWGRESVDATAPMTVAELRASVERVLGADLPMSAPTTPGPHRLHRLVGNSRQADRYRAGRVFVAGDAAHIHAPVGGPGLNLGLQDAVNLGWKLAAELRGWAPSGLLDTYHDERHPVGRRVLMQTMAQTALMAPGTETSALREVFGELLGREENLRYVAGLMAGADVRYPTGGDDADGVGANGVGADGAAHPLAGRWLADLELDTPAGPLRLAHLLRAARPVLIDASADGAVADAALPWKDRVDAVHGTPAAVAGVTAAATVAAAEMTEPFEALLVRPDGFVAWAAPVGLEQAAVVRGAVEAVARWFGVPAELG